MKKQNDFDSAAGTANHGMYGMAGPGGTFAKNLPAVVGVAKSVGKKVVGGVKKYINTVESRMKAVNDGRVERNRKILESQGLTFEQHERILNTPLKKKK